MQSLILSTFGRPLRRNLSIPYLNVRPYFSLLLTTSHHSSICELSFDLYKVDPHQIKSLSAVPSQERRPSVTWRAASEPTSPSVATSSITTVLTTTSLLSFVLISKTTHMRYYKSVLIVVHLFPPSPLPLSSLFLVILTSFQGEDLIVLEKGEFLCPLCRRIGNCLIPIVPDSTFSFPPASTPAAM